jgi:hypothetical protein
MSDAAVDDYAAADHYLRVKGVAPVTPAPVFDPDVFVAACMTFYCAPAELTERDLGVVAHAEPRLARKMQGAALGWHESPVFADADAATLAAPLAYGEFSKIFIGFFERYARPIERGTRFRFAQLEQRYRDLETRCLETEARLAALSPVPVRVDDDPDH